MMGTDAVTQIAIYWLFCTLLAASALLVWSDTGQRRHLWFAVRQVALTVAVTLATVADHLPALVAGLFLMALNILAYQPTTGRRI